MLHSTYLVCYVTKLVLFFGFWIKIKEVLSLKDMLFKKTVVLTMKQKKISLVKHKWFCKKNKKSAMVWVDLTTNTGRRWQLNPGFALVITIDNLMEIHGKSWIVFLRWTQAQASCYTSIKDVVYERPIRVIRNTLIMFQDDSYKLFMLTKKLD